ncbi:hypothetical protein CDL15_Pgr009722 [Punica granatum]|uniref:Uncharacterized protein n=1 Tax=Punica granatum TaxID=22663 RepID=A0A218WU05_PUNGR|nr:hypothetical protein CDL15_Pgr009722 [Punica granatum]
MAILAQLPNPNLFSSLPSTPPKAQDGHPNGPAIPPPPIPIPKYPPPLRSQRPKEPPNAKPPQNPALKAAHRNTRYYKPVRDGEEIVSPDGDRSVLIGESGMSYLLPGAPFEFQFSYSETPKVKPIALREPAFLPFAPPTMPRPWTGKAPLKSKHEKEKKKKIPLFDSFNPPPPGKKGVKYVEMPGPFPFGKYPKEGISREEVLGEPLKKWEIKMLVKPYLSDNRQVNLGQSLSPLVIIRISNVEWFLLDAYGRDGLTHNMLELIHLHWKRRRVCKEKTGGKVIYRIGGVVYLFRGRNYNYQTRPQYPVMLWKPAAPVYPKLIQEAPEGLTKEEAAKNGIYLTLVRDVRNAFEESPLVKVDCKGMHASDYKKLGAKLKRALESSKALLLDEIDLSLDDLLKRVEEFEGVSQAAEHTFPAYVLSSERTIGSSAEASEDGSETECFSEFGTSSGEEEYDDDNYDSDLFEEAKFSPPLGELPVDRLVNKLLEE